MSDIFSDVKKHKKLNIKDVPHIKHNCIMLYGYDWWKNVDLNELFEQIPLINKEIEQRMINNETLKSIAKSLGVKFKK